MKKLTSSKLVLNRNTLRALNSEGLAAAAGGKVGDAGHTRPPACPWTTRNSDGLPCTDDKLVPVKKG